MQFDIVYIHLRYVCGFSTQVILAAASVAVAVATTILSSMPLLFTLMSQTICCCCCCLCCCCIHFCWFFSLFLSFILLNTFFRIISVYCIKYHLNVHNASVCIHQYTQYRNVHEMVGCYFTSFIFVSLCTFF